MRFSDGIEFDFGESNVSLLEPGARGLVVKNRAAFEFRHGTAAAGRILGEFQNGTVLKNEGERLALTSSNGEVARDFTYGTKAPWPEAPAEGGFSLVLVAPETNPDHALGSNWRLSARPGGTPGSGEELSFAIWAISYGVLDPGSDEDLDGRSALLEYAMGSDPTVPDPENLPGGRVDAGDYLTFSFHRSILAEDIVLTLERSSNLEVWVPVGEEIVLAEETPNGDGTANRIYRSTLPLDGFSEKIMFLRVRVTLK